MHRFDLLAGRAGATCAIEWIQGSPVYYFTSIESQIRAVADICFMLQAEPHGTARHCTALRCTALPMRCLALRCEQHIATCCTLHVSPLLHACLLHVACCKYVSCALRAYLLHAVCCLHVCCVLRATKLRIMRARSRTTAWSRRTTRKTKRGNTSRRRRQQSLCACVCARACVSVSILQVHGCLILRRPPPLPHLLRDWAHPWHICRD
jgi:hypothetical protein